MKAILTGDIIRSREWSTEVWQDPLKEVLHVYGTQPKEWEIFRGDSFQLMVKPEEALLVAIHIKASIRSVEGLDVRIAIGVGARDEQRSDRIIEQTGEAFIRSGECFDQLGKQTLAVSTGRKELDEALNLMIRLALLTMNNWSAVVSSLMVAMIRNPDKSQSEIASLLNRSQSTVSETLKRGGYDEIRSLITYYHHQISLL